MKRYEYNLSKNGISLKPGNEFEFGKKLDQLDGDDAYNDRNITREQSGIQSAL